MAKKRTLAERAEAYINACYWPSENIHQWVFGWLRKAWQAGYEAGQRDAKREARTVRPDIDAGAMIELRRERDALLAASDHLFLSDRSFDEERERAEWVAYRQTLRDLPAQAKPTIPAAPAVASMRSA